MCLAQSFVAGIFWQLWLFAQAQHCIIDRDCFPPKCCGDKCCSVLHVQDETVNNEYTLSYYSRLNIWNMWYFWFIVLFILVTCFGVCGYWRRRQFILNAHHRQNFTSLSLRRAQMSLAPETSTSSYMWPHHHHIRSSRISGNLSSDYVQPPPYSEVATKPNMYPVVSQNVMKDYLPPYPYEDFQYYMCDEIPAHQTDEAGCSQEHKTTDPQAVEEATNLHPICPHTALPVDPPPYSDSEAETQPRIILSRL